MNWTEKLMDIIGPQWIRWPARTLLVAVALAAALFVADLAMDVFGGVDVIADIEDRR